MFDESVRKTGKVQIKKTGRSFLPSMFIQKDFDIFKTRKYVIQNKSFLGQILVSLERLNLDQNLFLIPKHLGEKLRSL